MDYELHVSIPMKGLPHPLFFLDTPPTTPVSSYSDESRANSPLPPTPRTPRKPTIPRPTCDPSRIHRSAIIRFEMSAPRGTPTLRITATSHGRSLDRVRKRLQWDSTSDVNNVCDYEAPIRKVQKIPELNDPGREPRYNADADDEMEDDGSAIVCLPSPPYSPVECSATADVVKSGSKKKSTTVSCSNLCTKELKVKTCVSCKTRKTPLWRDSEDGTPYCNACGIRYKKYRVRCPVCSYIPHKDENINNICCICGASLVHCKVRNR